MIRGQTPDGGLEERRTGGGKRKKKGKKEKDKTTENSARGQSERKAAAKFVATEWRHDSQPRRRGLKRLAQRTEGGLTAPFSHAGPQLTDTAEPRDFPGPRETFARRPVLRLSSPRLLKRNAAAAQLGAGGPALAERGRRDSPPGDAANPS